MPNNIIVENQENSWRKRAGELAAWAWDNLVNRVDCYGRYYQRLHGLHETDFFVAGKPIPIGNCTVWRPLTSEILRGHFLTFGTTGLVGLHSTSPDDTCKWVEFDIDQHDPGVTALAERNYVAAMAWYRRLRELGFVPLLWHSNGLGGFRLNVRFDGPIPAVHAYTFGRWIIRDWREYGLPGDGPEVFPKQRSIRDTEQQAGNYVRLIGRHHKRSYYPQIYDGGRWLRDGDAVQYLLSLAGQSASLIPPEAISFVPSTPKRQRSSCAFYDPAVAQTSPMLQRARAILNRWRVADAGSRNSTLFQAGCVLGERLSINETDHEAALLEYNLRFPDPLNDREVRRIARSSFGRTESKRGQIKYAPTAVESFTGDDAGNVSVEVYRVKLREQYLGIIGKPGIYLDTTQVGGGKTHQGLIAASQCQSSLHVIPTHTIKEQVAQGLVKAGVLASTVAAFPERSEGNCQRFDEVQRMYRLGVSVPSALCSTCDFARRCPHIQSKDNAERASHSVATMARMEYLQLARIGANKEFIKVDEDAVSLLRPTVKVDPDHLRAVLNAVEAASQHELTSCEPDAKAFFGTLASCGSKLLTHLENATACTDIPVPNRTDAPPMVEFLLTKGYKTAGVDSTKAGLATAKDLLFGFACGQLTRCVVQVDHDERRKGPEKCLVGVWTTELPHDVNGQLKCPIVFADGTADAEILADIIGEPVIDITPAGRISPAKRIVQVPLDIKRSTSAESFLEIVRGIMIANPSKTRIGIICHSNHHRELPKLGKMLKSRIVKATYFASGEDRASNEWLELGLDLLLVVGTPRTGPGDVRTRMIQLGLDQKATSCSKWINRWWQGVTERGEPIVVKTRQYEDPIWQRAYEFDVQASLKQAIGRARAILPSGIDVIVVSTEPLDIPLLDETVVAVCKTWANVIDLASGCSDGITAALIMERLRESKRNAQYQLSVLQELGVITKRGRGRYYLTEPWSSPIKHPSVSPP